MHAQRIWIGVFAALGALAAFLPWADIMMSVSVTGMDTSHGWVALGLGAAALVVAATGARREPLDVTRAGVLAVLGLAITVFGVWKYVEIDRGTFDLGAELGNSFDQGLGGGGGLGRELGRGMAEMLGGDLLEVGIGVYVMIAAGAALLVAALLRAAKRAR